MLFFIGGEPITLFKPKDTTKPILKAIYEGLIPDLTPAINFCYQLGPAKRETVPSILTE